MKDPASRGSAESQANVNMLRDLVDEIATQIRETATVSWNDSEPPPRLLVRPIRADSAPLDAWVENDIIAVHLGEWGELSLRAEDFRTALVELLRLVRTLEAAEVIEEFQVDWFGKMISSVVTLSTPGGPTRLGRSGFRLPFIRVHTRRYRPYR